MTAGGVPWDRVARFLLNMSAPQAIPRTALAQYAALSFPLSFVGLPLYILVPDLYATERGLSLSFIGFSLLALRIFDAVQDPFIGLLSDRYAKWLRATMLVGLGLLVVSLLAVFNPPLLYVKTWFVVTTLLAATAFSVISINFNALGGVWSRDVHERTRITAWREAVGFIGMLAAVTLPTLLQRHYGKSEAFVVYSLLAVAVLLVLGGVFVRWLNALPDTPERSVIAPSRASFYRQLRGNRRFFLIFMISAAAASTPAVLAVFFIRDRLEAGHLFALFLLLNFVVAALSMPLWTATGRRFGKVRMWKLSMLGVGLGYLATYFLGAGDIWLYAVICVVNGFLLGADACLAPSILADLIEGDTRSAAGNFAIFGFLTKCAFGLASGIALPLLALAGYVPGAADNSPESLHALGAAFALLPAALKLLAGFLLWRLLAGAQGIEVNTQSAVFCIDERSGKADRAASYTLP